MHTIRFDGKTPGIAECDRETALLAASAKATYDHLARAIAKRWSKPCRGANRFAPCWS